MGRRPFFVIGDAMKDKQQAWLAEHHHHVIERRSNDFPELLRQIQNPPTLIYVSGDIDCLHLPSIAIVGSRNPTRAGVSNAGRFAAELAAAGFCIVSGLAQGIDAAAHRGAMDGGGKTVAVVAHGMDRIYPRQHRRLAGQIGASGAIVSEYPLGFPPRREHFPQRNRLISGLCVGTLVVEAARRSGSLITARLAAEQGREVFAIPGSIHNPMSRGSHRLIRQGAKLTETAADIVEELGSLVQQLMQNDQEALQHNDFDEIRDKDYKLLIDALGFDPATTDEIAATSGLTIEKVSSMLLNLELEGHIEAHSGGQYSRTRSNLWQ